MKKRFSTILTVVLGATLMVSCEDDKPNVEIDPATNKKIQTVMDANYLWALPTTIDENQGVEAFFTSLINKDKDVYQGLDANGKLINYTYSRISPTSTSTGVVYDPGFEYAINNYLDNVTYYVVLYVKPKTSATDYLSRGLYITTVNGIKVTKENAPTLLYNAYKDGKSVDLMFRTPMIEAELPGKFTPVANYVEAPMHTATVLSAGSKTVGYIAYNSFASGSNFAYDNSLATKLTEFKKQGVTDLVFDVRYNSGGSVYGVQALGSALVKNRDTNKAFIQQVFRPNLQNPVIPLNFVATTRGKTPIPTLGDDLDKIYIITGQTTAGAPEALINAIKAYRPNDIVIVGEKTKGINIATAHASENGKDPGNWNLTLAFSYLADVNKSHNYAGGFAPTIIVKEVEVAAKNKILLGNLGTKEEVVLSQILAQIGGTKSALSIDTRSTGVERVLKTSLGNRPGANETTVDLQ